MQIKLIVVVVGGGGGGVPPDSLNPYPISDQKSKFSVPVFRPGLQAENMLSLLRSGRKQTNSSNPFRIRIFLFFSYSFGIETIKRSYTPVVPPKTIPGSRPNWAKCIPVFTPKQRKNPTRWGYKIRTGKAAGFKNYCKFSRYFRRN